MLEAHQMSVQKCGLCGNCRGVEAARNFFFAVLLDVLCSGMGSSEYGIPHVSLFFFSEPFGEFVCKK